MYLRKIFKRKWGLGEKEKQKRKREK